MGAPRFEPSAIGLMGFDAARDEYDIALDEDTRLRFGAVSTGNPHAVIEVADVDDVPVSRYGSALQQSPAFAESANVGFAQVVARDRIRLRVFERGVGEARSEEPTSELQSLMRISYAVFCLKKKNHTPTDRNSLQDVYAMKKK